MAFYAKRSENTAWLSQQWSVPGLRKVSVKESDGNRGKSPTKACMAFHRWQADKIWEIGGPCSVWWAVTMLKSTGGDSGTLIIHLRWIGYSLFPGTIVLSAFCYFQLELFEIGWEVSVNFVYQKSPIIFTVCDRWSPDVVLFTEEDIEMHLKPLKRTWNRNPST